MVRDLEPDFVVGDTAVVRSHEAHDMFPKRSLRETSWQEAMKHKWIESEKASRDVGDVALESWAKEHWPGFLRARWIEHLKGSCFWVELSRDDFGLLQREFLDEKELVDKIVDRLLNGGENLSFVCWYHKNPPEICKRIREILIRININSNRLTPYF